MRDAYLKVSLVDDYTGEKYAHGIAIASPMIEAWEPVDVCDQRDVALLMRMVGKNAHTEESVRVVRKRREGYAKILAEKLAQEIVRSMEANDMKNGWPK